MIGVTKPKTITGKASLAEIFFQKLFGKRRGVEIEPSEAGFGGLPGVPLGDPQKGIWGPKMGVWGPQMGVPWGTPKTGVLPKCPYRPLIKGGSVAMPTESPGGFKVGFGFSPPGSLF